MKKIKFHFLFICTHLLIGCSTQYILVYNTASTNAQKDKGYWVFENDTVKIVYQFMESKGVMSFAIFNKLNKPIYIDWRKSSYISNGNKFNYWEDVQKTNMVGLNKSYFYSGTIVKPGYIFNESFQFSSAVTSKPERITFLPPRTYYPRAQFRILPDPSFNLHNPQSEIFHRSDNPKKEIIVYYNDFTFDNSPLKFRNYLAFSLYEDSQDCFFIDNEFYLTSINQMELINHNPQAEVKDSIKMKRLFSDNTSFYITFSDYQSNDYKPIDSGRQFLLK